MQKVWHWLCPDDARTRLGLPAFAFLLLVSVLTLGSGLTTIPVMDRDEARYAQASKQMLESGDVFDIRFQDQPRYVKPIGTYWLQSASAAALGGVDASIAAYRLPSFLAGVLAVLLTAWFGARTFGATAGLVAGLLLAAALVLQVEARTAKTDALLMLSILVAQLALARIALRTAPGPERFVGTPLVFWLAQGAGLLIKGPIITLVSGTTILLFALWQRDWNLFRRLRFGPGLLVMLAMVAPWLIIITIKGGSAFFEASIGHALLGKVARDDDSHGAPPGYHTLFLLLTFWPGILLLGLALAAAWRRRRDAVVRFLIAWILPTWIVFELVVTKLPHYTLPVFPAIALLTALGLRDASELLTSRTTRWLHWLFFGLFALFSVVLAAVPVVAAVALGTDLPEALAAVVATLIGIGLLVLGFRLARAPGPARLVPLSLAVALFYGLTFHVVFPGIHALWPSDRVATRLQALQGCPKIEVATAGYPEPSNVFHFGKNTLLGRGPEAAAFLLDHPDCGLAVVEANQREAFDDRLADLGATIRPLGHVDGLNVSKGRMVSLDLLTLDSSKLQSRAPSDNPSSTDP